MSIHCLLDESLMTHVLYVVFQGSTSIGLGLEATTPSIRERRLSKGIHGIKVVISLLWLSTNTMARLCGFDYYYGF
ncbi:hypothetical protein ES288_D11G063700v1 [Gossypium darwinii]|uniref:Uncharacterized protein n=2 Tax=Gossypium TaxID=3633 RepID=A0A5D2IIJ2_GOSTO|nr:hypothetical protein ES288_D11G063700v1 [Gossypium darwinii]TYH42427.1 hypothetical protein ES332_D11G062700v1 [Gossypium tomentosum]